MDCAWRSLCKAGCAPLQVRSGKPPSPYAAEKMRSLPELRVTTTTPPRLPVRRAGILFGAFATLMALRSVTLMVPRAMQVLGAQSPAELGLPRARVHTDSTVRIPPALIIAHVVENHPYIGF